MTKYFPCFGVGRLIQFHKSRLQVRNNTIQIIHYVLQNDFPEIIPRLRQWVNIAETFVVELPLTVMDEASIAAFEASCINKTADDECKVLNGKKVLLVEDNEMNRETATEILEENVLIMEPAEDGELAVNVVSEKGAAFFDFILMDIQMPHMNGYKTTKKIR